MDSNEIRKKFLDFFQAKGHAIVPSSSLIPTDPSVLFTTAGMQQFKPYYLGEKSPYGDSVVSVQKCFRTSDLDSIGDEFHLSFFEMLGNFSFGSYFKEDAIKYAHEFITKEMGLKINYVSVFGGDDDIPADEESEKIWKSVDPSLKIVKAGKADNFWGPTGSEGPCGPTSEIYINGVEIWNLVFNEYFKDADGKYSSLKTPGVDTGMGLERLAMASQEKNNIFETDILGVIIKKIEEESGASYDRADEESKRMFRVIADHTRATIFLIVDGIRPGKNRREYILRRLLRRAILFADLLAFPIDIFSKIIDVAVKKYKEQYKELETQQSFIEKIIWRENEDFRKTITRGMHEFEKKNTDAFILATTYGFPIELTQEVAKKYGTLIDLENYNKKMQAHQELSRTASAGMFKSGLADNSEMATKYHTATHLLLASLRKILGEHVYQKGSNITSERLRFDFSHPEKITAEQIKQAEDLVNEKIRENLPVQMEEISLEEAKKSGAMGVFEGKYGDKVKVYTIGNPAIAEQVFSREICAGPHAERTGILGKFKITKEEASSAGVRRIKAILE